MAYIKLYRPLSAQPQYIAPIGNNPLAKGLSSAVVFDNPLSLVDRATGTRYPVTNASTTIDSPGRVLRFTGSASYVNTGAQRIGGVDLLASAGNPWSVVICGRLISSAVSGSFIAKCGATAGNRQFQIYRDVTVANADPGIYLRGTLNDLNWDYNTELWHQYTVTWDGTTAKAYGDNDRSATLSVGAAAAESENIVFGARTGGSGFFLNGQLSYAYVYNRAISQEESVRLFKNPWQVFQAPSRKIWVPAGAASYSLTADSGSFAATGTDADLKFGRLVSASSGSVALTGTAATLKFGSSVAANSGSFSVTGTAASLLFGRALSAGSGSVAITGTDATLTKAAGGQFTLSADSGTFVVTGNASSLVCTRYQSASSGSAIVTGTSATLKASRVLLADSGTLVVTGTDATLTLAAHSHYSLAATGGSVDVVGANASLVRSGGDSFSGGYPYISRESHAARKKKQRIELGIEEEILQDNEPLINKELHVESVDLGTKAAGNKLAVMSLIPARQQKKLEQEAIHAELRQLLQLEQEREEEEIVKLLMNF